MMKKDNKTSTKMVAYDHEKIEKKWRAYWNKTKVYRTEDNSTKPKSYVLDMFPYPSGEGLHVGHPRGYIATDVYSRFKRMNGFNVLHPMGWDAFGLPAENYAIKNKINPEVAVKRNVKRFKDQINLIGLSYDWTKEINTTDPKYYKWTQWMFLKMFEKGLAYESFEPINWCPSCKTGLANEDVEGGKCERCGTIVIKKPMRQWVLKITKYAERLLKDIDPLNWPEHIKELQRNWIGRSEGSEISFKVKNDAKIKYVLLHGYTGSSQDNFFPWLKKELEKTGAEVVVPNLPNTDDPIVKDQVDFVLKNVTFDENTILVGHSLGGVDALKILEKLSMPIKKTVLVGCFAENRFLDENFASYAFDWKFDVNKIKKNAGEMILLRDLTDTSVPQDNTYNLHQLIGGELFDYNAQSPHFCGKIEPAVLSNCFNEIKVFTTRPDTLFGVTYLVIAPENALLEKLSSKITNYTEVKKYVKEAGSKPEIERTAEGKEKSGVELKGIKVINPVNNEEVPVFVADYVLGGYGTGAVMAVPAHDDRDFAFAKKYNLPIKEVISGGNISEHAYVDEGIMVNSGKFNGRNNEEIMPEITKFAGGEQVIKYKLKDWVFSRQRYWGEPIPVIHCPKCGVVAVLEKDLPVKLPKVKFYEPSGTGESPLANIEKWVNVKCPKCKDKAKRETNTMPQWAGSSWYYLRYIDPKNNKAFVDPKKENYWMNASLPRSEPSQRGSATGVDMYVGGAEHATRHLIYARFWHKFLFDIGVVSGQEPFMQLKNQGMVLGSDNRKMSKSWGNVVNPDEVIENVGADTLRVYESFMGPFEQEIAWSMDSMVGSRRFLERVWKLQEKVDKKFTDKEETISLLHKTIKKVGEDIETFNANTAISAMMIFLNFVDKQEKVGADTYLKFIKILSPFAPYICEEIWANFGNLPEQPFGRAGKKSITLASWPKWESSKIVSGKIKMPIQINGKVRGVIDVNSDLNEAEITKIALSNKDILKWTLEKEIKKTIFVKNKIINFII